MARDRWRLHKRPLKLAKRMQNTTANELLLMQIT